MNCYLCLIEMVDDQSAVAVCQHCGAGICGQHLIDVQRKPVIGTAGAAYTAFRYRLICRRCYRAALPSSESTQSQAQSSQQEQRGTSLRWRWWKRLWNRQQPELPAPEDVIEAAELFLKRQQNR